MYSLIKVSLRQKAGRGHGKGQGPYDPAPFHNDINISFIENNVVYFIGYNYTQNPLFIRAHELANISYDSNKTAYDFCGFMQESTEPEYKYLTSDCKKLNFKLKNIPFLAIEKTDYDIDLKKFVDSPIVKLSKKTNDALNSYQNQLK